MTDPTAPAAGFGDFALPFQIEAPGFRGRLVRIESALAEATARHAYPAPVAAILAETLAMAAVLASCIKYDGIFTAQLRSDGPVHLIVVDVTSDGDMRGYARFDADRVATLGPAPPSVPRLLGAGQIVFTVDQVASGERYQGITPLEGATLSDCCQGYFRQSEQIETAIILCSVRAADGARQPRAAGLMLQRLPGEGGFGSRCDDDWHRALVMMGSVTSAELLAPDVSPEALLYRLFHEDGVRVYRSRPLRHHCRCSRERVVRALQMFPEPELRSMLAEGRVNVTCEFCKLDYALDAAAIEALLRRA
jgi:molecular chaperone Hsp33